MAKKSNNQAQLAFFEKLKTTVPPHLSLVNEISDVLSISVDGAYRRLRGETALSMDELIQLCAHFKLSMDSVLPAASNQVSFSYFPMERDDKSFERYFNKLFSDLDRIAATPDHEFIFAAEDIPIFYYFNHPTLSAFKFFYWNKCVLGIPSMSEKQFEDKVIEKSLLDSAKRSCEVYNRINCTEIWSDRTVMGVLKQIEFVWDSGGFKNKEDALRVLAELSQMMDGIRKSAENGYKPGPQGQEAGKFTMYHSEIMLGIMSIFVRTGDVKAIYLAFNTFNTIVTTHSRFCNETEEWMASTMRKSVLVSGSGEKHRNRFFSKAQKRIDEMKNYILHAK